MAWAVTPTLIGLVLALVNGGFSLVSSMVYTLRRVLYKDRGPQLKEVGLYSSKLDYAAALRPFKSQVCKLRS